MRRLLAVAAAVFLTACGVADDSSITGPKIQRPLIASPNHVLGCATDFSFASVRAMLLAIYLDGSPDENAALGKFNNIEHHYTNGSQATAQQKAQDLASFTLAARAAGKLVGSELAMNAFLNALYCLVGLGPYNSVNGFFIYPSDEDQIIYSADGFALVKIPAGNVEEPTLLTITPLTTPPTVDTELDVYPLYYDFHITNDGGTGWLAPVTVGVCSPGSATDPTVQENLLLGHQGDAGFELLDYEDVTALLDCTGVGGTSNLVVDPDSPLILAAGGAAGVGGSTEEFSPIVPVDSRVVGSAGEGGNAENFRPRRGTPTMKGATPTTNLASNLVSLSNVSCTAEINEEVDASCRPEITFHTPSGNSIVGVEVAWTVASGDGLISVTGSPCPDFKAALTQYSDNDGKTTVCWQLGNTPGLNTVEARATPSGEAPDGVKFVYDDGTAAGAEGLRFSATATLRATTTTVTCASPVVYKAGAWEHCTASVSDADGVMAGATTTIAYQNNINAGTATATASFAGDATHSPSSSSPANFTIDKAPATATAGSASMLLGSTVPSVSCTVTGLLGADATPPGAVTCSATPATPTSGGSFPIVPVVSPSNPPNYNVTLVNGTLTVTVVYTQVGCFAQPIYSVMPETKSAQRKGSNVPVKCTLKLPNGSPVTNATGDLIVYELNSFTPGTTPQPPAGAPSLSIPGAFQASSSGTYTYGLNTSPAFFKIGKAYLVRAFWNDNSTTSGYFIVK